MTVLQKILVPVLMLLFNFAAAQKTNAQCTIENLTVETECTGEGSYSVSVIFDAENPTNDFFDFVINGEVFGFFSYDELPATIEFNAPPNVETIEVLVNDNDNFPCNTSEVVVLPDCVPNPDCDLDITFAENQECNNSAQFFVDFEVTGLEEGDQFTAFGNGENYGTFTFGETLFTVGPFDGDGADYELVVQVVGQEDCSDFITVEGQNCLDNFPCEFTDLNIEFLECDPETGTVYLIDFDTPPGAGEWFTVAVDDEIYESYTYESLPITVFIPGQEDGTASLTICDVTDPTCCAEQSVDVANCDTDFCNIQLTDTQISDCTDEGFYITFGVNFNDSASDGFVVFFQDETVGEFGYSEDSYTVGPFYSDGEEGLELFIHDAFNDGCSFSLFLGFVDCQNETECDVEIVDFTLTDCNGDGNFFADFQVIGGNPGDTFTVTGNGENYGTFNYGDESYGAGLFAGDGVSTYEIVITDGQDESCNDFVVFDALECEDGDCSIDIGGFEYVDCTEEVFYIAFSVAGNFTSDSFTAFGNGESYGFFEYGADSYVVGPFDNFDAVVYELIVHDVQNEECTAFIEFVAGECEDENDCEMSASGFALDCVDDEFSITLTFEHSGVSEAFSVFGNGTDYGDFLYDAGNTTQVTIGPLPADETSYGFTIFDNEFDCSTGSYEVGQIDPSDCSTGAVCDLEIEDFFLTSCLNGQFFVNLFLGESFGSDFGYYLNGEFIATFSYGQEVYVLGPFEGDNISEYEIEFYDNDFDQCFDFLQIDPVFCGVGDCFIDNVNIATGECNEEGTYPVFVDFDYPSGVADVVSISHENEIIGSYFVEDLPIVIENFAGNDPEETFLICFTEIEDCCAEVTFATPQCEGLTVWPGDANFDGITSNFDIINLGIAFNAEGPARAEEDADWFAQNAFEWENNFASGINYAHADTDGNGVIDFADAEIVTENYGLIHGDIEPYTALPPTETDPLLFVDMPDDFELIQGEAFEVPVIFGTEGLPVDNVYGIAFTLNYDPEIIDPTTVELQYPVSWMGFPQTNLLTFDNHDPAAGTIDVALTKIDQNNVSGYGRVMHFIGIIDNIAGKVEAGIDITNVYAVMYDETRIALNTPTETVSVTSSLDNAEIAGLDIFPNPTDDILHIKNASGLTLQDLHITDTNGRVLRHATTETEISLADFPAGVYWLRLNFGEKTTVRKIIKL